LSWLFIYEDRQLTAMENDKQGRPADDSQGLVVDEGMVSTTPFQVVCPWMSAIRLQSGE